MRSKEDKERKKRRKSSASQGAAIMCFTTPAHHIHHRPAHQSLERKRVDDDAYKAPLCFLLLVRSIEVHILEKEKKKKKKKKKLSLLVVSHHHHHYGVHVGELCLSKKKSTRRIFWVRFLTAVVCPPLLFPFVCDWKKASVYCHSKRAN